jgi:hypothetical protein
MASTYVCEWMTRRVHTTIRQSAKIPSMMGDEKTVATREGTYFNRLNGGLDLETYKALCADTADVVLETIYYCQSELGSLGKSLYESRKILNPNFDPDEEVSPAATVTATYIQRLCMHVLMLIIFL